MSKTRDKLDEAAFFLDKLREFLKVNPDFDYYLSGFIGAARSVFWVMRHEYGGCPGWQKWYDAQTLTPSEKRLLEGMNDARVTTVHREPLHTGEDGTFLVVDPPVTDELAEALDGLAGTRVKVTLVEVDEAEADAGPPTVEVGRLTFRGSVETRTREMESFPGQNVLEICEAYYSCWPALSASGKPSRLVQREPRDSGQYTPCRGYAAPGRFWGHCRAPRLGLTSHW